MEDQGGSWSKGVMDGRVKRDREREKGLLEKKGWS